jgi:hypothetical protein
MGAGAQQVVISGTDADLRGRAERSSPEAARAAHRRRGA